MYFFILKKGRVHIYILNGKTCHTYNQNYGERPIYYFISRYAA